MRDGYISSFQFDEPERTYLWMVDIVGFSKVEDSNLQKLHVEVLFRTMYRAMSELTEFIAKDPVVKRDLTSDDATVIWTGDGAIVAMKDPFSVTSPFILSHIFKNCWEQSDNWRDIRPTRDAETPKLHMAAHTGKCRWLRTPTLRSPIWEVSNCFGVPINELNRIASFSTSDGDFVCSPKIVESLMEVLPRGTEDGDETEVSLDVGVNISTRVHFFQLERGLVVGKDDIEYQYRRYAFLHG